VSTVNADAYLDPAALARLGAFELRARMVVEGIRSGLHKSPYFGFSVEFAQHRQYVQGDDLRHLDWKVFGRSDKLHIKQFEQETNLDVLLLVDASGSMGYGSLAAKNTETGRSVWTKFDYAITLAAALSYLALHQQDRVGLSIFSENVSGAVTRSSAMTHWRQIVATLAAQRPSDKPTRIGKGIDGLLTRLHNRAVVVLISDLFDDIESIRAGFARLRHRGHDLLVLQVLDREELRFDFRTPAPFEGFESEGMLRLDPRALRKAYLEAIEGHCRKIQHLARGFGFDYARFDSHESLGPALSYFLARRNASGRTKGRLG